MSASGCVDGPRTRLLKTAAMLAVLAALAAGPAAPSFAAEATKRAPSTVRDLDPAALAARIDAVLGAGWEAERVVPAPPADDAEFLRRASLDIIGKIPAVSEVRAFLSDKAPDKRRRLVENLLARGGCPAPTPVPRRAPWRRRWRLGCGCGSRKRRPTIALYQSY